MDGLVRGESESVEMGSRQNTNYNADAETMTLDTLQSSAVLLIKNQRCAPEVLTLLKAKFAEVRDEFPASRKTSPLSERVYNNPIPLPHPSNTLSCPEKADVVTSLTAVFEELVPQLYSLLDYSRESSEIIRLYLDTEDERYIKHARERFEGHVYEMLQSEHLSVYITQLVEAAVENPDQRKPLGRLLADELGGSLNYDAPLLGRQEEFARTRDGQPQYRYKEVVTMKACELLCSNNPSRTIQNCMKRLPEVFFFIPAVVQIDFFAVAKDRCGSHAVECIFSTLRRPRVPLETRLGVLALMRLVVKDAVEFTTDMCGNFIVKHLFEDAPEPEEAEELKKACAGLSEQSSFSKLVQASDVCGGVGGETLRMELAECLRHNLLGLSMRKDSSYVAECIFRYATPQQRFLIIQYLAQTPPEQRVPRFCVMCADEHGNYVAQSILRDSSANPEERAGLVAILRPFAQELKRNTHGYHVLNKFARELLH